MTDRICDTSHNNTVALNTSHNNTVARNTSHKNTVAFIQEGEIITRLRAYKLLSPKFGLHSVANIIPVH